MCALELPAPDEIEAVLFDLDDTLVDARGGWRAGFAEAIEELHARHDELSRALDHVQEQLQQLRHRLH